MSDQVVDKQKLPEQLSEILLVLDKEKKKILAVKGIDENGKMETVEPNKKNQNQFMRVDRHGDLFSNFFTNFFSQLKDPTKFSFFKVPAPLAINTAKEMQEHLDRPTPEGKQLMERHQLISEPEQNHKNKNQGIMETTQTTTEPGAYRYKPEQIDWETMTNLGLSRAKLEKMNLLDPLLRGYKTNELVPVSLNLGTAITRMDARLSLQQNDEGAVVVAIHGIRKEPNLNYSFFGHEFSKEDKDNLRSTGNMGRVVNLTNPKTGDSIPSIISVDRLTNELVALRTEYIKIPDEIKSLKLDDTQKLTLLEGKPLYLEGMISKKGTPFDATVQFNADKRYVEFMFDRSTYKDQAQNKQQDDPQSEAHEVPKIFRGKELDPDQYQKFKDGQTIYLSGLVDKKGKQYNGYITYNKETNKTGFTFQNPNKIKEQVIPNEAYKSQIAVNSEGKTHEATKDLKEPLKSGQIGPDSKQQQEQRDKHKPAKSKGRKM